MPAAAKRKDKQGLSNFAIYNKYKGCVKWALIQSSALQAGIVIRLSFGDITFAVIKASAMFTSVTDLYYKFEHSCTIVVNVNLVVS